MTQNIGTPAPIPPVSPTPGTSLAGNGEGLSSSRRYRKRLFKQLKWTTSLIKRVRAMALSNMKAREIGAVIGCTERAVHGAHGRYDLGLLPPGRPEIYACPRASIDNLDKVAR